MALAVSLKSGQGSDIMLGFACSGISHSPSVLLRLPFIMHFQFVIFENVYFIFVKHSNTVVITVVITESPERK